MTLVFWLLATVTAFAHLVPEEYVPGVSVAWHPPPPSGDSPRRLHCTTADDHCARLEMKVNLTVDCILPFLDANRADAENVAGKLAAYGAIYPSEMIDG